MSWVAAAVVGGAVIGTVGASKAAGKQAAAADRASDTNLQMFERQNELQEPFRQAGLTAQNRLLDLLGLSQNMGAAGYGSLIKPFSMADYEADPGYGFRLSEGMKALDRTASSRGRFFSGASLKEAQRFGQGLASEEYQNAFNRFQVNRSNVLTPLQAFLGQGQSATNVLSNNAGDFASRQGNTLMAGGAARASGYMGAANALSSALGQGANMMMFNNMFPKQYPGLTYSPGLSGYTYDNPAAIGPQPGG